MPTESDESANYYIADGKKIPLTPSRRFVAVRTDGNGKPGKAGAARSQMASIADQAPVYEIPEHHIALLAVPPGASPGAQSATAKHVKTMVAEAPDLEQGPPVYETGVAGPEALVAIPEVVVKFRDDASPAARQEMERKYRLQVKTADYPEPGAMVASVPKGKDPVATANALYDEEAVEFAEPHFAIVVPRQRGGGPAMPPPGQLGGSGTATPIGSPAVAGPMAGAPMGVSPMLLTAVAGMAPAGAAAVPSDPAFSSQWALLKIRAPEAWDISMGSPTIAVAVIDEGCDLTHEDIDYKTPGYDAFDGNDDPTPQAADGHGTSCAGIATARANNGKGGAGVAPRCKTLPIRIAKGIGGGFWDTSATKVADGIRKAVDRGADVLSNSYGVGPSTVVTNALKYARAHGRGGKGCVIVAATGNDDALGVIYPARLSPTMAGMLAVGASNEWDQRKSKTSLDGENWWGSNYGPEVDVVAPGVHVFTTDIMGTGGYGSGNYVPNFNGTSSATPHVAGLAGLILSVDPGLRSWEVSDIIKLTAVELGTPGRDPQFGHGRIDARRALEAASRLWYEIKVMPEFLGGGRDCFLRMRIRMYNPGINTVRLDGLTVTSHNKAGTAELDRWEYRPNPGTVLAPRSGEDVGFHHILLKGIGSQSEGWSYHWATNWTYTFWRPSAPSFPLVAGEPPAMEPEAITVDSQIRRGHAEGLAMPGTQAPAPAGAAAPGAMGATPIERPANWRGPAAGDRVTVDRDSREITIVVR